MSFGFHVQLEIIMNMSADGDPLDDRELFSVC